MPEIYLDTTAEGEHPETGTPLIVDVRLYFVVQPESGDEWNEPYESGGCAYLRAERLDTTPHQAITNGLLFRLVEALGPKMEGEAWVEFCERRADEQAASAERRQETMRW